MNLVKKIGYLLALSFITFIVFDLCVKGVFIGGISVIATAFPVLAFNQLSVFVTFIKYVFTLLYLRFVYMFVTDKNEK